MHRDHPTTGQQTGSNGALPLRPASQVMQLERLGSFHQSRLSFMRTLVRRMVAENWQITSPVFDLDEQGYGTVVYRGSRQNTAPSAMCFSLIFWTQKIVMIGLLPISGI